MSPSRPGRRLAGLRAFLSVLLLLDVLAVAGAVLSVLTGNNTTSFEVPRDVAFGERSPELAGTRVELSSVVVRVEDPSAYQLLLDLLAHSFGFVLAAIPMIVVARRLIDHAVDDHPFTPRMVTGLRRLGRLILGTGALALVVSNVAAVLLVDSAGVPGAGFFFGGNVVTQLWWLPLGLVVLAFAQVLEHGQALRTELDEVV